MTLRVGMIGLGGIGKYVLDFARHGALPGIELVAILVKRPREEAGPPPITADAERFFAARPEAVLEGAGHQAVRDHAVRCLESGADFLATSVGAFADDALLDRCLAAARRSGKRLILPSAGIGALDILAGVAVGGLDAVTITVRKAPLAWKGTPGETLVDLDRLDRPHVLYDGPVRQGAKLYPQNINISAATALAGIGLDRTRVVVVADPTVTAHVCEIEAQGAFGKFSFREDVLPTPENPKTGRNVAMSVVKTLRQLASPLVIGA
ncbi:MAG: aspartate dehydrogenase [Alphaproteobacteria bacterium]|nr:aspartate dehydrogenase [Alphaproteobacteria bacterium]